MRVGIVTQPLCANYGGILQNYALQQVLKKMGHTPITLDYLPSLSLGRYILYVGKGILCSLSPTRRHPIKPYNHYIRRPADIDFFVRNNINLTRTIPDYTERILRKNKIEALLLGSDQVWRYAYNSHYIDDMYFGFAKNFPCRKISYGASFGIDKWDYPEEKARKAKKLIRQFSAISVRESSAIGLCKDYLGVDAKLVLDPTLLLSASDYELLFHQSTDENAPYLAAYILDFDEKKKAYIDSFAKLKGLIIKDMTVSDRGVSIEKWLSTIRNAEFIITDSYHGSLFSIIFQKQFQTIINKERGADRFLTVFSKLGLEDRLLEDIPSKPITTDSINFKSVCLKLQHLQDESVDFLQKTLIP